jgi:F0F1-type ATP synthase epsilon subunit
MTPLILSIATVTDILFEGEVESVTLPTGNGEQTILAHHEPLVVPTEKGVARIRMGEEERIIDLREEGVLTTSGNTAQVLL